MVSLIIMGIAALPIIDIGLAVLVVGLVIKLFKWVFSSKK